MIKKSPGFRELLKDKIIVKMFSGPLTVRMLRRYIIGNKSKPTFKKVIMWGQTFYIQEPLDPPIPDDMKNFDSSDFKIEIIDFGKNEQQEK